MRSGHAQALVRKACVYTTTGTIWEMGFGFSQGLGQAQGILGLVGPLTAKAVRMGTGHMFQTALHHVRAAL